MLQAMTILSKALLLFTMSYYLSVQELGIFGLMLAAMNMLMYLLGMEFYTFSRRAILHHHENDVPRLFRDQLVFHGIIYLLILPISLLLFVSEILPSYLIVWFYLVLVLDHIAQELQRFLITLSKPIQAAFMTFIRAGAWVYVMTTLMIFNISTRNLNIVFASWFGGISFSILIAVYWLRNYEWKKTLKVPVNWPWINKGWRISLPFMGATFSIIAVTMVSKLTIKYFWGIEYVGIYTFYLTARNSIQSIIDTGITFILQPKIITAYQSGKLREYSLLMRQLTWEILILSTALFLFAGIAIKPIISLLDKPIFATNLNAYWIVISTVIITAIDSIFHSALYVRHHDRSIMASSILGMIFAVIFNLLIVPEHGLMGAAISTVLAGIIVNVSKMILLCRNR